MLRLGKWSYFVLAVALGGIVGCSEDPTTDVDELTGASLMDLSGLLAAHPLSNQLAAAAGTPLQFTQLRFSVQSALDRLAGLPARASLTVDTTASGCADGVVCPWSATGVNVDGVSVGLLAAVEDLRETNPMWVETGTGLAAASTILGALNSGLRALQGLRAFAVSTATATYLSGLAGQDVLENGFILGTALTPLSVDADGNASPDPVEGVGITASVGATPATVLYLGADMRSIDPQATATAAHGTFLVLPPAPPEAGMLQFIKVSAAKDGSAFTWARRDAGTEGNAAFVLMLAAEEGAG